MIISHSKYSGCGNTFVLVDNRSGVFLFDKPSIQKICREKSVDGVILVENSSIADYRMRIFNSDGSEAEMCGNGLRCFGLYLKELGEPNDTFRVEVMGKIYPIEISGGRVTVAMVPPEGTPQRVAISLDGLEWCGDYLDTGVPHYVLYTDAIDSIPIASLGPALRHHPQFAPRGTNVNFVKHSKDGTLHIRTYERGVEAETLACGTGAAAAAISGAIRHGLKNPITVKTRSGEELIFEIRLEDTKVTRLIMEGPANKIY